MEVKRKKLPKLNSSLKSKKQPKTNPALKPPTDRPTLLFVTKNNHKKRSAQKKHKTLGYIFSGATTPMRVKALCITICMACVNAMRASLSSCDSAFMTGSAL